MNTKKKFIWLHLGASAFHRAHQSWYLNRLKESGDNDWQLSLANIRNCAAQKNLQQLTLQKGRYTLESISPQGETHYQTIRAIENVILWEEGLFPLIAEGARQETKIISFTVTEGGYYLKDNGQLDTSDIAIRKDLDEEATSTTLYGALVKIFRERMQLDSGPVTLLSCDNLRNNGDRFHFGLIEFIKAKNDPALLAWVESKISSPNSMVDRITPKFNADIYARLEQNGIHDDKVPVSCESFSQWVIEDKFITNRPLLETVGVEFVDNVAPYEEAKIRVINASHSCVAWAGTILGKLYIDESVLPQVQNWILEYVLQDVKCILPETDIDLKRYCLTTLKRFSNKWIRDTNQRVTSNSIVKLHEFILPTLKAHYERQTIPAATLVLPALYFRFMQRRNRGDLVFEYQDRALKSVDFERIFSADDPLAQFTQNEKIFGSLSKHPTFLNDMRKALQMVDEHLHNMKIENALIINN